MKKFIVLVSVLGVILCSCMTGFSQDPWFAKSNDIFVQGQFKDGRPVPSLYQFNAEYLRERSLKKNDQSKMKEEKSNFIWNVRRNSTGNKIYIFESLENNLSQVLMINPDLSTILIQSDSVVFEIDNSNRIIMNSNSLSEEIRFNKFQLKTKPFSKFAMDYDGKDFFICEAGESTTKVYSIDSSGDELFSSKISGLSLFFSDNKLYLFGTLKSDYDKKYKDEQCSLTCQIYSKNNLDIYQLEQEIHIPRKQKGPTVFDVRDFDLVNKNVLLVDGRDYPSKSHLYLFNLKTKTMDRVYFKSKKHMPNIMFLRENSIGINSIESK